MKTLKTQASFTTSNNKLSVLLVDDNEDFLTMLTHFIIKFVRNVLVNASSSPEVAIKCIEEKNYDIIITDYQMPRMNGVELIKRARNKGIKTPFIIFSAIRREEIMSQPLESEELEYISKFNNGLMSIVDLLNSMALKSYFS